MSLHDYAEKEMAIAWPESDPMQDSMKNDILAVIDVFSGQGHSGTSAAYALNILDRLLRFKPISPLTGNDDEWEDPISRTDNCQQNKRCSSVFRKNFDNSTAYDIDGKVFSDDGGETFWSTYESRTPVTFPYTAPVKPERIIINDGCLTGGEVKMSERPGNRKVEFIESYWTGGEYGPDYIWSDNHGELVRCRECIRRGTYDCPIYVGGDADHGSPDDWFCADGERRDKDA